MTFAPDISDDFLLIDGSESVTFEGAATVNVPSAKRGTLTEQELMQPQLGLTAEDMAWSISASSLPGVEPQPGDVVRDSGASGWTVVSASKSLLTNVWRLLCRKQR